VYWVSEGGFLLQQTYYIASKPDSHYIADYREFTVPANDWRRRKEKFVMP
jgi:membrane protein insertase Oxa1/YidC/SpoIIIJ